MATTTTTTTTTTQPPQHQHPSTLLPSSIFSTPSFSSTLPLPGARQTSASGFHPHRPSTHRQSRTESRQTSSHLRGRTRSMTSDITEDESDDGGLGDLSMENYTIDLAVLARRSGRIGGGWGGGNEEGGGGGGEEEEEEVDGDRDRDDEGGVVRDHSRGQGRLRGGRDHGIPDNEDGDFLADYEVDLGGLGDKSSSIVVEDRQDEREEVGSEADGPDDFTLNMGAWMRGTRMVVKERDIPSDLDEQRKPRPKTAVQDAEFELSGMERSIMEPLGMSTPTPNPTLYTEVPVKKNKAQAGQRPLLARGETELMQNQAAEEVFQRISVLQAEVEEMREAEERRRLAYERLEVENQRLKSDLRDVQELQKQHRALKERNEDLQMALDRAITVSATAKAMSNSSPSDSRAAAEELVTVEAEAERERMASDGKIETLEAGLRASHGTVRQLREEMAEDEKVYNAKIEGLKEDLERLRTGFDEKRSQIADMEQDAETQKEIIEHRDQLIARLTTDVQVARTELGHAQQEARESRRIANTVEEENDRLTSKTSQQTDDITAMEAVLQCRATELQAAHATISALREAFTAPVSDEQKPATNSNESSHQAALDSIKQEHDSALTALNQKFAWQLQLFKQDRETQASKHAAELAKARETLPLNSAMETELRTAIRALSSKLEKANLATRAARVEVEKAHADVEKALHDNEIVKKENEMVNQALEARFAETVEAREREWRRRIAVLFRERKMMGKALMVGWGREDNGEGVRGEDGAQGYRYRFFKR